MCTICVNEKMKKKDRQFPVLLTPRENEVLKEIPKLVEQGKLPNKNQSEIFRRGLHSTRQLIEVNEKSLLKLLVKKFEESATDLNKENIESVKALSSAIYATFIAKHGILGAEFFQSIPLTCQYLDLIETENIDKTQVVSTLRDLATSIRTMFLTEELSNTQSSIEDTLSPQTMLEANQ